MAPSHIIKIYDNYVWQSRVEMEDYSIVYFNRITVFEVPYCWTAVKGGAHMHFVDSLDIKLFMHLRSTYEPRP